MKIPYLVERRRAGGRIVHYWQPSSELRAAGFKPRRLPDEPAQAAAAAVRLNEKLRAWRDGATARPAAGTGTVAALIEDYRRSRFYLDLAVKSKKDYSRYLTAISEWIGPEPVAAISEDMVEEQYRRLRATGHVATANYHHRVLGALFAAAVRLGYLRGAQNPARSMRLDGLPKRPRAWSAAAVAAIVAAADRGGRRSIGDAVLLGSWTGQRLADLVRIEAPDQGGVARLTQNKRGARVALPIGDVPELAARFAGRTGSLIVCETTGRPWRAERLSRAFAALRAEAAAAMPALAGELATLELRHLRHTAVTRLAEAGCEIPMIAAISGHSLAAVHQILEHYLDRTEALSREAFRRRVRAER